MLAAAFNIFIGWALHRKVIQSVLNYSAVTNSVEPVDGFEGNATWLVECKP